MELVDPENEYGQVRSGEISIRCCLIRCRFSSIRHVANCQTDDVLTVEVLGPGGSGHSSEGSDEYDHSLGGIYLEENDVVSDLQEENTSQVPQATLHVVLDEPQQLLPDIVYFTPLVVSGRFMLGILLDRHEDGLYTRLGYWDSYREVSHDIDTKVVRQSLNQDDRKVVRIRLYVEHIACQKDYNWFFSAEMDQRSIHGKLNRQGDDWRSHGQTSARLW